MKFFIFILAVLGSLVPAAFSQSSPCNERRFDQDSFVCVCDGTTCDFQGTILAPTATTEYTRVRSDRDTYRFDIQIGDIDDSAANPITVHVNPDYQYQTMFGFGGAFTDSTGINVKELSDEAQDMFIRSYFAPEGIQYDVCRIPIAGSDFSTRPYSYDDVADDVALDHFALAPEDYSYKLPLIQAAQAVSNRDILFFGSPWAPPAWMKSNGEANGNGYLLHDMYDPYSNYLVKFIEAYENEGIPIWGITPQNEPLTGNQDWAWNTCYFSENDMKNWINESFGPIMEAANLRRVKVMLLDHNRDALIWYPAATLENPDVAKYVDGTAVHWYSDGNIGPERLSELATDFPDKFILYTEACEGWYDHAINLGDWQRAENYANNILEDINHFSTGWVDWNMALSITGGPNWANNWVDSPVIVNTGTDEFFKQPMFYAMGHFSKFILPGAKRIYSNFDIEYADTFSSAAFINPDGTAAIVLLNKDTSSKAISIEVNGGRFININMTPKSLETILITL